MVEMVVMAVPLTMEVCDCLHHAPTFVAVPTHAVYCTQAVVEAVTLQKEVLLTACQHHWISEINRTLNSSSTYLRESGL